MRFILIAAARTFLMAGCALLPGGDFALESKHGYCGSATIKNTKVSGCPTIDGNGKPMGSRTHRPDGSVLSEDMFSTYTDGSVIATGPAALALAEAKRLEKKALLCAISPEACGREPPPELLGMPE